MNEVVPQILPLNDSQPVDTSGTVGTTVVDAMSIIESASRRCGIQPTALTPENLDTARINLFLILSRMVNRGINLWAVDQFYMSIVPNKVRYALPPKTEGIVGLMHRTVTRLPGVAVLQGTQACTFTLESLQKVAVLGFKLPQALDTRLVVETTVDGTNWDIIQDFEEVSLTSGWHWYALDAAVGCIGMRVRDSNDNLLVFDDMVVSNATNDLPITRYNRDQYTILNNKLQGGKPNAYYFEKKIECAINFWPVPVDDTAYFMVWRHRAVQDVGSLMNKLEVPDRWLDGITWMLSKNLGFELPGVDAVRLQLCIAEAEKAESAAELGESDGGPMFVQPNIHGYTA